MGQRSRIGCDLMNPLITQAHLEEARKLHKQVIHVVRTKDCPSCIDKIAIALAQAEQRGYERGLGELISAYKTYNDDGIASDKFFDAGIRHKSGCRPVDFLNHWLKICRPHAYATQDDSWGELEKLLAIIIRNYVNFKTHIRPKLEAIHTKLNESKGKGE